jgi:hypothetical protein
VFRRYDIVSNEDLKLAARQLDGSTLSDVRTAART